MVLAVSTTALRFVTGYAQDCGVCGPFSLCRALSAPLPSESSAATSADTSCCSVRSSHRPNLNQDLNCLQWPPLAVVPHPVPGSWVRQPIWWVPDRRVQCSSGRAYCRHTPTFAQSSLAVEPDRKDLLPEQRNPQPHRPPTGGPGK